MPPEVHNSCSLPTSVHLSAAASFSNPKAGKVTPRMKSPGKKIILLLVFILSSLSILRLLRILMTTTSPSLSFFSFQPPLQRTAALNIPVDSRSKSETSSSNATALTAKEFQLLSNIVSRKAPCNVLIFGLESQYINLSSINAGGITIFLEDNPEKIRKFKQNYKEDRIYEIKYQTPANQAYKLLKHARKNPDCAPGSRTIQHDKCKLRLRNLPWEVLKHKWDVIVVDGPCGDAPEAPGRMATIYTASILARAGKNATNVLVHDADRTIEKWYSGEFLCEENLVSSKGKMWNFRITGKKGSCLPKKASIL